MKKKLSPKLKTGIQDNSNIQISAFVKNLSIKAKIPEDLDSKKVYVAYLEKKYR